MRDIGVLLIFLLSLGGYSCGRMNNYASFTTAASAHESAPTTARHDKVDFKTQIEPILRSKCQPCHFSNGSVYDKLPFDRADTIKALGTKLFTRIKDENDRKLIREFLDQ